LQMYFIIEQQVLLTLASKSENMLVFTI